jgi:hypothetical protein
MFAPGGINYSFLEIERPRQNDDPTVLKVKNLNRRSFWGDPKVPLRYWIASVVGPVLGVVVQQLAA